MESNLTPLESRLLVAAYRTHETLRRLRPWTQEVLAVCSWHEHLAFKELRIFPSDGQRWAGLGGSGAERTRISRAFASLDAKRLLLRVDSKHVKLTRKGMALAKTLQGDAVMCPHL